MNPKIYYVKLGIDEEFEWPPITITEGDTEAVQIKFIVYENKEIISLLNKNVTLTILNPNGSTFVSDFLAIDAQNSMVAIYNHAPADTPCPGICKASVEIYDGVQRKTTQQFTFTVKSQLNSDLATRMQSNYPVLTQLIGTVDVAKTNTETATTNAVQAANNAVQATVDAEKATDDAVNATANAIQATADLELAKSDVGVVGSLKAALDSSRDSAETAKTNLDGSIASANISKTELDGSIENADNKKVELENVIKIADTTTYATKGDVGVVSSQLAEKTNQIDLVAEYLKRIELNFVNGVFSTGTINYTGTVGICSENYIQLANDVIIIPKNADCKFKIAYYTSAGAFTGIYSDYLTTSQIIKAQENRSIRIMLHFADDRVVSSLYPLKSYVDVFTYKDIIPSYWISHLETKIAKIKALQKSIGFNGTSFAFITDMHIKNNSQNSPALLKKVMNDCNIPYYFDGGDFTTGASNTTKLQQLAEIDFLKTLFKPLENRCLRTIGNHDDNSIDALYSKTIIDFEMYDILYRQNSKYQHVKSGKTGEYYYIDDEMQKIRYITLNCVDIPYIDNGDDTMPYSGMTTWAFRQEQIDWFSDVALNVPNNEWSVVVCSHIPINQGYIKNDSIAMNVLQAFKDKTTYTASLNVGTDFEVNKSVDYSGKGGDVICWLAGHTHLDSFITLPGNITFKEVTTLNDSLHVKETAPTKTIGTITENAFDIFTVDKINRVVNITRIGAGVDRSFSY